MNHKLTLIFLIILALCMSVIGVLAQDGEDDTFPGEGEVMTFFNNMGIDGEIVYQANSTNPRDGEPNWCYDGERWGDDRCSDFPDEWINDYNWWLGWILAHCQIPGYFPPDERPEECDLLRDNRVNVVFGGSSSSSSTSSSSGGSSSSGSSSGGSSNTAPTAAFSYACTDLDCSFDAAASSDSDGSIVAYDWAITDGFVGTASSFDHTFAADGTYTVTLTVTDNEGATATTTDTVTVADGSGGSGTANIAPSASFGVGCTDLDCDFASTSSDSDGTIVSYTWSFGDGSGGTGANPSHSYGADGTYTVTLTVTDDDGAIGTASQNVTVSEAVVVVNNPPTASFGSSCTDLDCDFTDSSSDSDGSIASYAWSFGDGGSSSSTNPSHSYSADGTYTVTLTVTDNEGATDTATTTVTVSAPVSGNVDLVASYTCSGTDIIVTITDGDGPFNITGGGPAQNGVGTGVYNIGARNGNIKVTETTGDVEQVSLGTNLCD